LAAAELRPAALRAAHTADVAKHQPMPVANLDELVAQAALAARRYEKAKADEAVARAEQKLAMADDKSKDQAANELKTARSNLEKADKSLAQPGTTYTSLSASLKALEGPDETDASRRNPYPTTSTGRRSALARWITSHKNPLTARVAVNHIWLRHFGEPLVESVTDFGRRANEPVHKELLDWLAVEFMENNWSMKHLHRLLVTSQTYRLSASTADADEASQKTDPTNQYFWRRNSVRMESQVIRDSLLQLAGALNPTIGGTTIDPQKEDNVFRRSIYFTHSRDDKHNFLSMFDDADILRCYRRGESIIPQQALSMANSKLSLAMSRTIAGRLPTDLGEVNDKDFVAAAFEMILCTRPTDEELNACLEAINSTKGILAGRSATKPELRARENLIHALLNHNDFVTIR
jgi:hypothetical protein